MNRQLTSEEIKYIEEDFTEDEFANLIAKIKAKKRQEAYKVNVNKLLEFIKEQGGTRIDRVDDNDDLTKRSIVYDYNDRVDIKIRFGIKSYGIFKVELSTRSYSFIADDIDELIERLPYIHDGIKNKII